MKPLTELTPMQRERRLKKIMLELMPEYISASEFAKRENLATVRLVRHMIARGCVFPAFKVGGKWKIGIPYTITAITLSTAEVDSDSPPQTLQRPRGRPKGSKNILPYPVRRPSKKKRRKKKTI